MKFDLFDTSLIITVISAIAVNIGTTYHKVENYLVKKPPISVMYPHPFLDRCEKEEK